MLRIFILFGFFRYSLFTTLECLNNSILEESIIRSRLCFIAFNTDERTYKVMRSMILDKFNTSDYNIFNYYVNYIYTIDELLTNNKNIDTLEFSRLYKDLKEEGKLDFDISIDNEYNRLTYVVKKIIVQPFMLCVISKDYIICACYNNICNRRHSIYALWTYSIRIAHRINNPS